MTVRHINWRMFCMTEINTAIDHPHLKLSVLGYDRHHLLAGAALQRVPSATPQYSVRTVRRGNVLEQRNQIQQLSIGDVIKPRCDRYLQDTGNDMSTQTDSDDTRRKFNCLQKNLNTSRHYLHSNCLSQIQTTCNSDSFLQQLLQTKSDATQGMVSSGCVDERQIGLAGMWTARSLRYEITSVELWSDV